MQGGSPASLTFKLPPHLLIDGEMIMLFREHRASLSESMDTVVEVHSMQELREHIQKTVLACFPPSFLKQGYFQISPVNMRDDRIDWDTYTVIMEGVGVLGFTNAAYFPNSPKKSSLRM